jgi:hypothetical protein
VLIPKSKRCWLTSVGGYLALVVSGNLWFNGHGASLHLFAIAQSEIGNRQSAIQPLSQSKTALQG